MGVDPITDAVRSMLDDSATRRDFALDMKDALHWRVSDADALRRCRQYFNGQHYRHLPAVGISIAVRVSGLDYVTPLLQRVALRAELEAEQQQPERTRVLRATGERRWQDRRTG